MPFFRSFDSEVLEYAHFNGRTPTLVFLPALGFDLTYWGRSVAYFRSRGFGVAAITLRGHGRERTKLKRIALSDHVRDVRGILNKLKVRQPVIVGASLGGLVAAAYAKAFPAKLCICINAPFGGRHALKLYIRLAAWLFMPWIMLDRVKRVPSGIDFSRCRNTNNLWMFLKSLWKFNSMGLYLTYLSLEPIALQGKRFLVIRSRNDEVLKKCREGLLIEGNHNCAVSRADEVNSLIERFIS